MTRNLADTAGEFLEPEPAPKTTIPLDQRIFSSGMKFCTPQAGDDLRLYAHGYLIEVDSDEKRSFCNIINWFASGVYV